MNIYEAVNYTYSGKKYIDEKLDDKLLAEIKQHIDETFPLFDDIRFQVDIIDTSEDIRYMTHKKIKAPYYICVSSTQEDKAYINTGYILENVALFLTTKRLGFNFVELNHVNLLEKDGLRPLLVLEFGKPMGIAYKEKTVEKRNNPKKMVVGYDDAEDIVKEMLDAACLAPSAYNTQPWRFKVENDRIDVYVSGGVLTNKRQNMLGIGTTVANIFIAADEKWYDVHIEVRPTEERVLGGRYVLSVVFGKGKNTF